MPKCHRLLVRLGLTYAIVALSTCVVRAEPPRAVPIRTIADLMKLGTDAPKGYPLELRGVVAYSDLEWGLLFLQDSTGSVFINVHGKNVQLPVGAEVMVSAVSAMGDLGPRSE